MNKNYFYFFLMLSTQISIIWADGEHLYGRAENIVRIVRNGELAEFQGNLKVINQTFTHPEVKDRKIVVFSIIGAYREGKSFFLDYCLRYLYANYGSVNSNPTKVHVEDWLGDPDEPLSGFSWKHGATADTKGLMMWSDVFLYDALNGDKIAIIVIDTQGLFEKGSNDEENAKIFSFSTLVSSIQIINVMAKIQENQIAHLQTAIDLTKLISSKQKATWKPFQNLIFLIRDFADDDYEFGYEGGKEYFENFFETDTNKGTKADVNRNSIRDSFDKISCFLLNFPGENIKNKKKFNGQWGLLKPEFKENLKILIESLLAPENLVEKSVLGRKITSEGFKDILMGYIQSFSTYSTPKVDNIFQIAVDNEMSEIVKEEIKKYKTKLNNEKLDYDRDNFVSWVQNIHTNTKQRAIDNFLNAEKIEDKISEEKFKDALTNEIEEIFQPWLKSTMDSYVTFKLQTLVNLITDLYRNKVDEHIDLENENFSKWILERHINTSTFIIIEYEKQSKIFNDEVKSKKFKKVLEEAIEENYSIWRINSIQKYLKFKVQSLQKTYEEKLEMENNIKLIEYEIHIDSMHEKFKDEVIKQFNKLTQEFENQEEVKKYKNELNDNIELFFQKWKVPNMKKNSEYLRVRQESIRNEYKSLIEKYKNEYKELMNQDIDFELPDFDAWLDLRHQKVKSVISQQFLEEPKIDNSTQNIYLEELKNHTELFFESFKPQKIEEKIKYLDDQQNQINNELEIEITAKVAEYRTLMEKDVEYDIPDFEEWLEKHHQDKKKIIVEKFQNIPSMEKSLIANELVTKLKMRLDKTFEDIQKYEIDIYRSELRRKREDFLTHLVNEAFEYYKDKFLYNITYGVENFATYIEEKHILSKNGSLLYYDKGITEEHQEYRAKFSHDLRNEIDTFFNTWKATGFKENQKQLEEVNFKILTEMNDMAKDIVNIYVEKLDSFDEIEKIFASNVNFEDEAIKQFKNATNSYNKLVVQTTAATSLANELKIVFNDWKNANPLIFKKLEAYKSYKKSKFFDVTKTSSIIKDVEKIVRNNIGFELKTKLNATSESPVKSFSFINQTFSLGDFEYEINDEIYLLLEKFVPSSSIQSIIDEEDILLALIKKYALKKEHLSGALELLINKYESDAYNEKLSKEFQNYVSSTTLNMDKIASDGKYKSTDLLINYQKTSKQRLLFEPLFGAFTKLARTLNVVKFMVILKLRANANDDDFQLDYFEDKKNKILNAFFTNIINHLAKYNTEKDIESFTNLQKIKSKSVRFKLVYEYLETYKSSEEKLGGNCKFRCDHYSFSNLYPCYGVNYKCQYGDKVRPDLNNLFEHVCDDCRCKCEHNFTSNIVNYIYLGKLTAPDGYVITGVRFATKCKTIALEIQVGKLLPMALIDKSTIFWKTLNILDCVFGKEFSKISAEDSIFLGGIIKSKADAAITGIKLTHKDGVIGLNVYERQINFGKGTLSDNEMECSFIGENFDLHYNLELTKPGLNSMDYFTIKRALKLRFNQQLYKPKEDYSFFLSYFYADDVDDVGSLAPFFDPTEVTFDSPAPISMIELVQYTNDKTYAGYIRPIIKSLNYKAVLDT